MMKHLRKKAGLVSSLAFSLSVCYPSFGGDRLNSVAYPEIRAPFAFAVSGTVTSKVDGEPLPGVSVSIKGTSSGTTTDANGKYSLQVENESAVLVFSFIGYASQEVTVGSRSVINITLEEDIQQLNEVVVTALGVNKETRTIGYSVSTVSGEQMNKARETNVALSLQGTVAGLNVKGTSSGPGGTAKILLRGMPSMNSGGAPLFVINGVPMDNTQRGSSGEWGGADYGDGIGNLNPDDIETMTVLKGQSASALYGARASNGVILITTKKGAKNDFQVEYNTNFMVDKAVDLSDWQYEYGQGVYGNKPTTATEAQATSRMSWGPRLDGTQVIQFDGNTYPYSAQRDNLENFYRTGSSFTNTVSLSKGGDKGAVRFSFSNLDNKSIVPNSGIGRKTFNINAEQYVTDKLSFNVSANYIFEKSNNRPQLSDGPMNSNNGLFLATNVNESLLAPGFDPTTGNEVRWGDDEYVTNPYFVINRYENDISRNRLISSLSTRYDFTDWLYAQVRLGYDHYTDKLFKVTPWGTAYSQGLKGGLDDQATSTRYEMNLDGLIGVNKDLTPNLHLDALVGGYITRNEFERVRVGGGPFILPYLYTPSNVVNFNRGYEYSKIGVNSGFYSLDFGYKDFITLTTTGRYDDFSTLYSLNNPGKKTGIFTPSFSTGFVFSEFIQSNILSFGKFRASYAQTAGTSPDPYTTSLYYSLGSTLNGRPMGYFSESSPNYTLQPFAVTEVELGFDLKFFQDRLSLDAAWYNRTTENEIMPSSFSPSTGATSGTIASGSTRNTGLELLIKGAPVRTDNFAWNVSVNFTSVRNEIVSTDANNTNQNLGSNRGTLGNAITAFVVGKPGPQILAYDYKRNDSGEIIVDASGLPVQGDRIEMGSVLPKYYGGINNEFSYKSLSLSFLIDYNFGNKVLSATEYYSIFRGLNKATLEGREDGITTGVTEEGTPNTVTAEAQDWYRTVAQRITKSSVVSGDFIKLRQVSLSYSVPSAMVSKLAIFRSVQVSFVGRNLAFLMRKSDNIDPEASFGSNIRYYGIEGTSLPSTRSYGVNLNLKFK